MRGRGSSSGRLMMIRGHGPTKESSDSNLGVVAGGRTGIKM